jgi:dihydropyrimidinase
VLVQCENGGVVQALVAEALAAGRREPRWFAATHPVAVEAEAVARTLAIAALARAPVYLVHLSCRAALARVRTAQGEGQPVRAEACTHHLVLGAERYESADAARYLVVPPLRDAAESDAIWQALADETLATVGSDHAQVPFRPVQGAPRDFSQLPYGLPGIELRLPLVLSEGIARGIALERLVELLAGAPARLFGLYPRKGAIVPGADADLVVWDPSSSWTVEARCLHDGLSETPYEGLTVRGRVRHVLRHGELVVLDGEPTGAGAEGRYMSTAHTNSAFTVAGSI